MCMYHSIILRMVESEQGLKRVVSPSIQVLLVSAVFSFPPPKIQFLFLFLQPFGYDRKFICMYDKKKTPS